MTVWNRIPFRAVGAIVLGLVAWAGTPGVAISMAETDTAELFITACAKTFPDFENAAAIAAKTGLNKQSDGTYKGDGYLLNPAVTLSGGEKGCMVMPHGTDPVTTANHLVRFLGHTGMKVQKASRKGRKTTILLSISGKAARIFVAPSFRTFTSISISQP